MTNRYHPESPEACALELYRLIRESEPPTNRRGRNLPETAQQLDLYALCLATVRGEREIGRPAGELLH